MLWDRGKRRAYDRILACRHAKVWKKEEACACRKAEKVHEACLASMIDKIDVIFVYKSDENRLFRRKMWRFGRRNDLCSKGKGML